MYKMKTFLVLGVWVIILPFLGFPYFWKDILFSITGLILLYISYIIYRERKVEEGSTTYDNFSENHDFDENKINKNMVVEEKIIIEEFES